MKFFTYFIYKSNLKTKAGFPLVFCRKLRLPQLPYPAYIFLRNRPTFSYLLLWYFNGHHYSEYFLKFSACAKTSLYTSSTVTGG